METKIKYRRKFRTESLQQHHTNKLQYLRLIQYVSLCNVVYTKYFMKVLIPVAGWTVDLFSDFQFRDFSIIEIFQRNSE